MGAVGERSGREWKGWEESWTWKVGKRMGRLGREWDGREEKKKVWERVLIQHLFDYTAFMSVNPR